MDSIDDATLVKVLTDACNAASGADFESIVSVASALRRVAGTDEDPVQALIAGLEYHLVLATDTRTPNGPFGPMIEARGKRYPASLDRIEELVPGTVDLWRRAASMAPLALVRARFNDLLWELKIGERPHEYAQQAIDAYIAAIEEGFGHAVEMREGVQRAIEVASQINDPERRAGAVGAAVTLIEAAINTEERRPGVALPLLEMLVDDRPDRQPPHLQELLTRAAERFGDDPWNLESALELQARLIPREERPATHTRVVEAFRDLARRSDGLVRYAHLQHAIEVAESYGLTGLADEVRREVEGMTEDELGLQVISTEVTIPNEAVEKFVAWFVGDDNLESALGRFGAYLPSGDPDENRAFVEKQMADHPLQYLVTRMQIGPENSLLRSTSESDAQAEQALLDHEAHGASIFSLFAVDILDEIRERYGPVSAAASAFETELIQRTVATKIGRSLELYEHGDFDSCASVLAPRLERVLRNVAGASGLTVTRSPDRRGRSGGVKGLGELLSLMEGALPEQTRRYLKMLLSEVTGLNLRNRISHGLDDEIAQREAVLLIHCACHLRLLVPDEQPLPDGSGPGTGS